MAVKPAKLLTSRPLAQLFNDCLLIGLFWTVTLTTLHRYRRGRRRGRRSRRRSSRSSRSRSRRSRRRKAASEAHRQRYTPEILTHFPAHHIGFFLINLVIMLGCFPGGLPSADLENINTIWEQLVCKIYRHNNRKLKHIFPIITSIK